MLQHSLSLSLRMPVRKANLPDVLFEAICRKVLETPVEAGTSVHAPRLVA